MRASRFTKVQVKGTPAGENPFEVVNAAGLSVFSVGAAGQAPFVAARTATAAGLTTGTIAAGPSIQFIPVTSPTADSIVILPAPVPGNIVILHVGANGYELRTSAPATIAINGGAEANAESAIGANVTAVLICATATSWKGFQMGAAGELALVQVAAAA